MTKTGTSTTKPSYPLRVLAVLVGAILTHARVKDPDKKLMPATVLFLLALAVITVTARI